MNKEKVVFFSVHPDDETLGCGGTILKHKAKSDEIYWIILTNISVTEGWGKERVRERNNEINKISSTYGFKETITLQYPPTKLDQIPLNTLINDISEIINKLKPDIIYINNRSDIHSDHKIAFQAVISCTKNFRYPFIKKILMYESLSETEFSPPLSENIFNPNVFVDITDYMDEKLEIMKIYKSEIMPAPLPRSLEIIEALAKYRGSRIGKKYAEAFMLLLEIR